MQDSIGRTAHRHCRGAFLLSAACVGGLICAHPALAAPPSAAQTINDDASPNAPTGGNTDQASSLLGFTDGLMRSNAALGDIGGLRQLLSKGGMTLTVQETSEVLGNATGGTRKGSAYDGATTVTLQMDTSRAFGWQGGTFNASALQIHGTNLSTSNLSSLQTASGIQSNRATRLWELWYQQKFLEDDKLDIRLGQQSIDQEFMASQNASYFVNTMFGWPMLPSADMPGGGPAYPLSALGGRARAHLTDEITLLAGVFNGSPTSSNSGDPQQTNPSGTSFPLNGGMLAIAEIQYGYPSLGTMISPEEGEPLKRLYKLGMWYNNKNFADQRYSTDGLSLSSPASNGTTAQHRGNYAFYAVADQMVWRQSNDPDRNISMFLRAMGTPLGNRNLINASLNVGLTMHEPIMERDDDTFGIGLGTTSVSRQAAAAAADAATYGGSYNPKRSSETFVELTYQYAVTPWLQLQPDVQYVFNPGGGVVNPNQPTKRIANELVLGLRTNINF